jgi:uncharacterized protein (TIGR03437 family)
MKTMKRTFTFLVLAGAFACSASAQPVVTTVVNRASYSAVVSPNCWVIILGYNFAPGSLSAPGGSLPTTLGGVSVNVAGLPAPLLYVSPDEIDALVPSQAAIPQNTVVPLVVTSGAGTGAYNIRLTRNAPAIFTRNDGGGQALVYDSNFRQVDTVGPQDTVIFYATGLGPTDGSGHVVDAVEVYIGERKAQVLFAGLAPGLPGMYQLNVTAPAPATDRLYLRTGGWQSNIVKIGIRSGVNTANVRGTIDGLYPSSDPDYPKTPQRPCLGDNDPGPCGSAGGDGLSIMLHAGTFTVSFDIVPGAGPFAVAAVGEAGGTIISIDPAAGTYTASVNTLTPAAAVGDFSSSIVPLWDYYSCNWKSAVCQQFPNSIIPVSLISPFWLRALQMLPVLNTAAAASPNALLQVSGRLSGSRFTVDSQNNSSLSTFGGIVQVPYGPFELGVSTFSLYVDGKLIASKNLPYLPLQRAPASFGPETSSGPY